MFRFCVCRLVLFCTCTVLLFCCVQYERAVACTACDCAGGGEDYRGADGGENVRGRFLLCQVPGQNKVSVIFCCICLKGHGNEADFLVFLQKLVPHRSLTLPFELFQFWLRIRRDIRNRKMTPRLGELATFRLGF
jgi:hypothetical protein